MTIKQRLLQAHLDSGLCYDDAKLRRLAKKWPARVTLTWLLRTSTERGIPAHDSVLRACKVLAHNADGRRRLKAALRVIVLRAARVHAADACERAGLHAAAKALRALTPRHSLAEVKRRCEAAAEYAADAAAYFAADAADAAINAAANAAADFAYDAAYDAINAAYFAADATDAADAAEREQQLKDLAAAAQGWVP